MKLYLVVSISPSGAKGLVGHYPYEDSPEWRSEVYDTEEDAIIQAEFMSHKFSARDMRYEVREIEI